MKTIHLVLALSIVGLPAFVVASQTTSAVGNAAGVGDPAPEVTATTPRYWNFFWMRGRGSIDVALFNYGQNLKPQDGDELHDFEVAGKDRQFFPAQAEIGSQLVEDPELKVTWISLKANEVKEPYYIRYAMGSDRAQANLVNEHGGLRCHSQLCRQITRPDRGCLPPRGCNPRACGVYEHQRPVERGRGRTRH